MQKISKARLLDLLNNLIEYVDMLKDSESSEDQTYFWKEVIGFTDDELDYFGFDFGEDDSDDEEILKGMGLL